MSAHAGKAFSKTGLGLVQRRRKRALLIGGVLAVFSLLFTQAWNSNGVLHEATEIAGIVLIGAAILGRAWCTLYIGGRKAREILAVGPYSVCRNPLYVFSCVGVFGMGLQTASVTFAFGLAAATFTVFLLVTLREEQALQTRFGADYERYRARVPRFLPRFSGWVDQQILPVSPRLVLRTLREGMLFFLAVPLCETVDYLHAAGLLHAGLRLP